jgi:hypothetical protein
MKPTYTLSPSTRKDKKWTVTTPDGENVHFGAAGSSDFTLHKDEERKESYIARHRPREAQFWTTRRANLARPSYWARQLLWEAKSLPAAIAAVE